ncbi:MAG: class I SAM-dependent methyltransferase [Fibrobacteres bacterium]|nr:class I SAM-dependent methyltransferase [Fibrobacterota bacterium]
MLNNLINYYSSRFDESKRHTDLFGTIQEHRSLELITRYLPDNAASILDVGGATGVYSFKLADMGHKVTLLDIVPSHIAKAKEQNDSQTNKLEDLVTCDIRDYRTDKKFDMIILHGPLYHITVRSIRISLLTKLATHLSPKGSILGFAINRFAGYFYGVRSGVITKEDYRKMVMYEMQSGIRNKEPGWYFHKPDELESEFLSAGLNVITTKSVTSQVWMIPGAEERISDPTYLAELIRRAKEVEDYPEIGQDMVCVGKLTD